MNAPKPSDQSAGISSDIVPATDNDLVAIRDLATAIWNAHYPGIITQQQIDYMLAQDYATEKLRRDLDVGVCIDQLIIAGKLFGFSAYGPTPSPEIVKLHKLYVDQSAHGKGFGSRLLKHCESTSKAKGFQKIILQVNKHNSKAIKAYTRNGYYTEKSVTVDIGAGFVMDDYIMAKILGTK